MQSYLAKELNLSHNVVAILFSDDKPADAHQLAEGKWGCVMALYNLAMKQGRTVAFDRKTYGCVGAGVGLCLGDTYSPNREFMENLLGEEEGFFKTRELVQEFMDNFKYVDIPNQYVIFKPLATVELEDEIPALISFPVNADQLSALATLINYRRVGNDHVGMPFGAGCQSICVLPFNESLKGQPRGIVGNIDVTARRHLPANLLTFTVPFKTFQEMEEDAPESFLVRDVWTPIRKRLATND